MDHIVHINNGNGAVRPIVLRLLPGEETIFNLKVVNHGEPSNISLQASSPVFKAVRLRKPNHYVVMEEIIPIMARMPANRKRLDGEILLSGSSGESRVPITLLRDSEDPGDDLEDPGLQGDEELKDDLMGEALEREEANDDRDDRYEEEEEESDDEDEYEDEDEEKETGKEPRRIAFSRDRDLQRYRSAARQRKVAGVPESREDKRAREPAGSRVDRDDEIERNAEEDNSRVEPRFKARIDDRFVDKSNRQDESPRFIPRKVPLEALEDRQEEEEEQEDRLKEEQEERKRAAPGYVDSYRDLGQDQGSESRENIASAERDERNERNERAPEESEEYVEQDEGNQTVLLDKLGGLSAFGALQVIPVALFLALVIVLVLTFITGSIPEFPGALASSILIVTLIIYGAATLLKA
ncbi:MAG: hypothetical protein LUO89_08960 [Methanothrix sp.]|nr:hypothetical protein [Methanothrix sp.]